MRLDAITDRTWDNLGVFFGSLACLAIAQQISHELRLRGPSSLTITFVGGYFVVYMFWFVYGLRFGRRGIWLPNLTASALQVLLGWAVLAKP